MEVYSDNSESPTKCHKHKKNFGCAIVAIVSSNKPNKARKAKNKLQSPPRTPTNVETPTSKAESGMGDMLEIMKMDMMSQMQQCHDQRESEREWQEDERIRREEERSRREEE